MKNVKWHIIVWIFYFLTEYISDVLISDMSFLEELIFFVSQNLFLFYGFLYSLNKFNAKSRHGLFLGIGRVLLVIILFIAIRYSIRYLILANYFDKAYGSLSLRYWGVTCFTWVFNFFLYSFGIFYFTSSIQKEKILRQSHEEKLLTEQENLRLENMLLRAQINPHFLYNTLSFLYSKSLPHSAELSDSILKLSDVMRYSLQSHDANGLVPLAEELQHIRNIAEINQLRFNNQLYLDCNIRDIKEDVRIIPLVLLTLTENVLKHGELRKEEAPARIEAGMNSCHELHFSTWNKKRPGPKELSTGIGLANTIRRLEQTYGSRCTVVKEDTAESFSISIRFQLQKSDNNNYLS